MLSSGLNQIRGVVDQLEKEVMEQEADDEKEQALKRIEQLTKEIGNKRIEVGIFRKLKEQEEEAALKRVKELD